MECLQFGDILNSDYSQLWVLLWKYTHFFSKKGITEHWEGLDTCWRTQYNLIFPQYEGPYCSYLLGLFTFQLHHKFCYFGLVFTSRNFISSSIIKKIWMRYGKLVVFLSCKIFRNCRVYEHIKNFWTIKLYLEVKRQQSLCIPEWSESFCGFRWAQWNSFWNSIIITEKGYQRLMDSKTIHSVDCFLLFLARMVCLLCILTGTPSMSGILDLKMILLQTKTNISFAFKLSNNWYRLWCASLLSSLKGFPQLSQ